MARLPLLTRPRPTVAVDLGTAFVRVGTPFDHLVVERTTEPIGGGAVPMARGVVNDIDAAGSLLAAALAEAMPPRSRPPQVVASIPATATPVERSGLLSALRVAGVRREPLLIEEPLAAAIGIGLDIADHAPHLVVDVGHGITEAAIIADGAIRLVEGTRIGCSTLWRAVERARTSVAATPAEAAMDASDLLELACSPSPPPSLVVARVRRLAEPVLDRICAPTLTVLEHAPVELTAEVLHLHLVGGGSLIPTVARHLAATTGLGVRLVAERLHAVALGDALCAGATARLSAREQRRLVHERQRR